MEGDSQKKARSCDHALTTLATALNIVNLDSFDR